MSAEDKVNILLVDDQPSRLLTHEAILGELGENLVKARSGTEALKLLMEQDFAVILLDVNMPGMDGFETATLIHEHPRFEQTPIIFVTAFHVTDLDRLKGYKLGAVDYVYIPAVPEILRSKVAVLVELYRKTRELQRVNRTLELANAELAQANRALQAEIAERKQAEAALRDSEERLRSIFATAHDAFVAIDEESRITEWNRQAENLFGWSRTEAVGRPLPELILPPQYREAHFRGMQRFLTSGEGPMLNRCIELTALRRDGCEFPAELTISVLRQGNSCLFTSFIRDITERMRAEAEVRQKNRDLETLLHVTSHDLREPLRAVQSFARLVNDRYAPCLDDKGKDFLGRIAGGANRLDRLLEDILTLSRAQRMTGPAEEIEGAAIVAEALDRLAVRVKETGARIRVADNLPRLRVDRTWATQAVYNLVANALKFTRNGGPPEVEVAGYEGAEDGPARGLVVRDRGPGVAPEHAERIFQLFQRAVGREVEGTGAGLAIVRQITRRHGGRAWVRPRPGGGAEFVITFQAAERNGGSS